MSDVLQDGKKQLRIVIADDSEEMRGLLKLVLSEIEGLLITGLAKNGIEAIKMVNELKPEVLLLDISMPHKSGIEVLKEIRAIDQSTIIIMYTVDPALRQACLRAGANFFLHKTEIGKLIEIFEKLLEG